MIIQAKDRDPPLSENVDTNNLVELRYARRNNQIVLLDGVLVSSTFPQLKIFPPAAISFQSAPFPPQPTVFPCLGRVDCGDLAWGGIRREGCLFR